VAVTLENTLAALYVGGEEVGRNGNMTLDPADMGVTEHNFLGESQWPDPLLHGRLDDFRIYDGALSAAEVAALATAGEVPYPPPARVEARSTAAGVDVAWSAVGGATYSVERAPAADGPFTVVASGLTATAYADASASLGERLYYRVVAASGASSGTSGTAAVLHLGAIDKWALEVEVVGDALHLTVPATVDGTSYQLQSAAAPAGESWQDVGAVRVGAGAALEFVVPLSDALPRRFYRWVVVP
ncbi:MAG: LamG-like jellyroll fold domain-containing protein, partial [Opitutales bacterium]